MRAITRLQVPDGWRPQDLAARLPEDVELIAQPARRISLSFLDSFDWRLWQAGTRLWLEQDSGRMTLHLAPVDEPPVQLPVRRCPRFAHQLRAGFMHDRVASALGVRALLPLGELVLERRELSLRDGDGNTCARMQLERMQAVDTAARAEGEGLSTVAIHGMPGHEGLFECVRQRVAEQDESAHCTVDPLVFACAASGREPGDYSSKPRVVIEASQPAGDAARVILSALLHTLQRNVRGVIEDLDSEFLHDLRVAVRRSRSLLSELKSVLDRSALEPYLEDMKWLGTVTGPLRDLDVYLLEMDHYRSMLPASVRGDLDGLVRVLKAARRRARMRVVRALRGARFNAFSERWEDTLHCGWAALELPTSGFAAVIEVAGERIMKAYRRVVKRGRNLGDDPAPASLHALRIDAKKLRYLLELFRSLYPAPVLDARVKELKSLQDILGGFNDMEVQQRRMTGFAHELLRTAGGRAEELLAMGRLQAVLANRQETFRRGFVAGFRTFDTADSETAYAAMCGRGSRS